MQTLVQPYDASWPDTFEQLKKVLSAALQQIAADIHHVGSTAIPGLCAKPIIDLDIVLSQKNDLLYVSQQLEQLGYINRGDQGIAGRYAFRQSSSQTPDNGQGNNWPEHHLYVCHADSLAVQNHLIFKQALLADATLVEAYMQLKLSLVNELGMTRALYNQRKTLFVLAVLAKNGFTAAALDEIRAANE